MKRAIWILTLIGFLGLLMTYSESILSYRETQIDDLTANPRTFENNEVLLYGYVVGSPVYENNFVKIIIESSNGNEVLLIVNSSLLNTPPKQGDAIHVKGIFTTSGSQAYVDVYLIHVRTRWAQRLIYLRSVAAIPVIVYFIRQGWDLVRM